MPQLARHPSSQSPDLRLEATLARNSVRYVLEGEIGRLRVPAPRSPRIADGLWQHTCFELFIGRADDPAYQELNFSPSGEWAAYAFTRYRQGASAAGRDPGIRMRRSSGRLELEARVTLPEGKLRVGVAAVLEDEDGALSYWALRHPPGKPDFHHADGFALEIDAIRN